MSVSLFDHLWTGDKLLRSVGEIGNPVSFKGSLMKNALSSFTLELLPDDPNVADLQTPGARLGFTYRGIDEFSGKVSSQGGSLLPNGNVSFTIRGDWRYMPDTQARVNPSNTIEPTSLSASNAAAIGQSNITGTTGADGATTGQTGDYVWPTDVTSAESLLKRIIAANFTRPSLAPYRPVTIPSSAGRGGNPAAAGILPSVRMGTLEESTAVLLAFSGLVLDTLQAYGSSTITYDVRTPKVVAAPLTVESGVVSDGSYQVDSPTATRALVGGPGDDAARAYREIVDATGMEDLYGEAIEVFTDGSGGTITWPSTLAAAYQVAKYFLLRPEVAAADKTAFSTYLNQTGAAALAAGKPVTTVSAKLAETDAFHFGGTDGVRLGDVVSISSGGNIVGTNEITEAQFELTSSGLSVVPILGANVGDTDRQVAQSIMALAAAQRRISTSR